MSASPFNESFVSKHVAPDFTSTAYEAPGIFQTEEMTTEQLHSIPSRATGDLILAINGILKWLIPDPDKLNNERNLKAIGLRAIAMAWVINPKQFNDESLASVAKHIGCTTANISPLTAEFSRQFGITNNFQKHNWRDEEKPAS